MPSSIGHDVAAIFAGAPSRDDLIGEVGRQACDELGPNGFCDLSNVLGWVSNTLGKAI
jgi:hypothetical protein